jgi:hypothetical protein
MRSDMNHRRDHAELTKAWIACRICSGSIGHISFNLANLGSVDVHCATSASDSATRVAEIGVFDPLEACVQVLPGPSFASHRRSSCWSFVVSCSFLVKQSHRHTVKLFLKSYQLSALSHQQNRQRHSPRSCRSSSLLTFLSSYHPTHRPTVLPSSLPTLLRFLISTLTPQRRVYSAAPPLATALCVPVPPCEIAMPSPGLSVPIVYLSYFSYWRVLILILLSSSGLIRYCGINCGLISAFSSCLTSVFKASR